MVEWDDCKIRLICANCIIIIIIIITKNDEQDSVEVVQEVTVGQHNSIRLAMSGFQ